MTSHVPTPKRPSPEPDPPEPEQIPGTSEPTSPDNRPVPDSEPKRA
jgi:hypothetical protein